MESSEFPRYRHDDNETVNLTEVGWCCSSARFVFDQPQTVKPGEHIGIIEAQIYLIKTIQGSEEFTLIAGKWDRKKQQD